MKALALFFSIWLAVPLQASDQDILSRFLATAGKNYEHLEATKALFDVGLSELSPPDVYRAKDLMRAYSDRCAPPKPDPDWWGDIQVAYWRILNRWGAIDQRNVDAIQARLASTVELVNFKVRTRRGLLEFLRDDLDFWPAEIHQGLVSFLQNESQQNLRFEAAQILIERATRNFATRTWLSQNHSWCRIEDALAASEAAFGRRATVSLQQGHRRKAEAQLAAVQEARERVTCLKESTLNKDQCIADAAGVLERLRVLLASGDELSRVHCAELVVDVALRSPLSSLLGDPAQNGH